MPRPKHSRKSRFQAALKLAGMTAEEFARDNAVSPAHLHYVVGEVRESERLESAIEAFIDKHLPALSA